MMGLSKLGTLFKCFDQCLKSGLSDSDCNVMIVHLEILVTFDEYPSKLHFYFSLHL